MYLTGLQDSTSSMSSILSVISLILIFIFIVALAYFTTKFIAKYQNNSMNSRSNIRVIESFRMGSNKFVAIIEVSNNFYVIGVGKEEITLIDKLDSDSISNIKNGQMKEFGKKIDFKEILSQIKNKSVEKEHTEDKDETK